jgi:uncharacterized protein (TIGR03437 family)
MRIACIAVFACCSPLLAQLPVLSPTGSAWGLSAASVALTGREYSQTFSYTGGTSCGPMLADLGAMPATFTWSATGASGVLKGTFTAAGKYSISISVTCANGITKGTYSVTVAAPMTMPGGGFLPPCNVGTGCMIRLTQGGVPPFTARVTSGGPPAGCELVGSKIGESTWGAILPCLAATKGTYSFQISVTDGQGETGSQSYVLQIAPPASFYTSSNTMVFKVTAGGAAQTQPLGAGTNDLTAVKFSASSDAAWLTATPDPGDKPSGLTVRVDPTQLRKGTYQGKLTVTPDGPRPPALVTVTAVVSEPAPMLELAPDSVTLDVAPGKDAARTFSIAFQAWNSGSLALSAAATAYNPSYSSTWLSVQPSGLDLGPGEVKTLAVSIDATKLPQGTYQGYIQVRSTTQSKMVPVTVVVPAEEHVPVLHIDRSAWHTTASTYHDAETYRYDNSFINVSNGDWTTSFDFTATLEGLNGAAEVIPASGRVTGSSWAELNFRFDHRRLTAGQFFGLLTVTAPGAKNSPAYARVEYEINSEGEITGSATPVEIQVPSPIQVAGSQQVTSSLNIVNSSNVPISYQLLSPSPNITIDNPNGVAAPGQVTTATYKMDTSQQSKPLDVAKLDAHMWSLVANTTSIHWEPMSIQRVEVKNASRLAQAACVPAKLVVAPSYPLSYFRKWVDWPVDIQAVVFDDCGNAVPDASVSASFSNGDPAKLLAPRDSAAGRYAATWIPVSPGESQSITLRAAKNGLQAASYQVFGTLLEDASSPLVNNGGIVNSANPVNGGVLAPGSVVAIYGKNLATGLALGESVPLPRKLGNTTVLIGGIAAPLLFVSAGQINAQLPHELGAGGQYDLVVKVGDRYTTPKSVRLAKTAPGIFAYVDGRAIAQRPDYSLVTAATPARPGEYVILYLAGMGSVDQPVTTGAAAPSQPSARVTAPPVITIGAAAAEVSSAGLTPGAVGLYQVIVKVPESLATGDHEIVLRQAETAANSVFLPVAR